MSTRAEGVEGATGVRVDVIDYGPTSIEERIVDAGGIEHLECRGPHTWIHVSGVHDATILQALGRRFGIHPLILEDITHTDQRAKLEDYDDDVYLVFRALHWHDDHGLDDEQISILLRPGLLITFEERDPAAFATIRERLRHAKGPIRQAGADYLAYSLIDVLIDRYFVVLEHLGEHLERLERRILEEPDGLTTTVLHDTRHELLNLRRAVWPARDAILALQRQGEPLVRPATLPYLRDAYDHVVQVIETVEIYRDMAGHQLDIYLSSLSHRMNEAMRVLTVIATIFIPLTFIAGVYGMNFRYMPELEHPGAIPRSWS